MPGDAVLASFVGGFSAPEGGPGPDPSTVEWVIGLIVVPVVAAVLSAAVTSRLWRDKVTSNLLYAPFWIGFIAAQWRPA